MGWLAAFLFVVCGALRLARFNVQRHVVDGRFFVGLPIPAAAAQVAAWVNFVPDPLADRRHAVIALSLVVVLAFLMVSTFRYHSFKKFDLRTRRSYVTVLGIALVFLLVALHPHAVLLVLASLYWLSGPTFYLLGSARRRSDAAGGRAPPARRDPRPSSRAWASGPWSSTTAASSSSGAARSRCRGAGSFPAARWSWARRWRRRWSARCGRRPGSSVRPATCCWSSIGSSGRPEGVRYHYVIVDYLCDYVAGELQAASDAAEAAWAAPADLPGYDLPAEGAGGRPGWLPAGGAAGPCARRARELGSQVMSSPESG